MNWKEAQKEELKTWNIPDDYTRKEKIEREVIRYPKLRREMGLNLIDLRDKLVVEIGGGPIGVIADLHCRSKIIIEPLTEEYKKYFPCPYNHRGVGEKLPWEDKTIDVIVIANALDHCGEPETVLKECTRALKAGGFLAIHSCLNLAEVHKHPAHQHSLDYSFFHNNLDYDFEFVHERFVRYGWVKDPKDGRVGQPAIAFLARKVTGY